MEERLTCLTGRMAPTPERLLAGVSGGADSVALLLLLLLRGCEVTAVHVHHGLRGAAADGDGSRILKQVTGGIAVRMAVMYLLTGGKA